MPLSPPSARMRAPDLPYPSFAFVMSQADGVVLRPSRTNHHRYHPYTRPPNPHQDDWMMKTVDRRFDDFPVGFDLPIPVVDASESVVNLQVALHGEDRKIRRRISLSTLVVDLAVALKQKCQGLSIAIQSKL